MNLKRAFLCLVLALVLSCGPARTEPLYLMPLEPTRPDRFGLSGRTPLGVIWFAHLPCDRATIEREIDAQVTDVNYVVVVLPGPFLTPVSPTGVALGLTDVRELKIYVAFNTTPGGPVLTSLRHEYHHVSLYNRTGSADPGHLDPSWREYY